MLDSIGRRTATTLRTIYFLPGAVTSSAVVVLWLFLLDPGVSPFQSLLHAAGWTYSIDVITGVGLAGSVRADGVFLVLGRVDRGVWRGAARASPTEVMGKPPASRRANRFQLATRIRSCQ
ncbi:MAG: sugar ABC transporter permease [Devosia sp.]|nr:sugar ABC transporter permease [Devosia sp.]